MPAPIKDLPGPEDVPGPGSTLILGGTGEARALALAATSAGLPVLSSLAGRVSNPALPVGPVRIGGFGGTAGLTCYLAAHQIRAVVDATHPFAATISAAAIGACADLAVPLLRLARPGWSGHPDASRWHWVDPGGPGCARAMELGERAFITTGRQTLADYDRMADRFALVRVVEPPTQPLSPVWELITDRGPYTLPGELELMRTRRIDVLVTKDSGGAYTAAKLDAAADLHVEIVIVRRPPPHDVATVGTVTEAMTWLTQVTRTTAMTRSRGSQR